MNFIVQVNNRFSYFSGLKQQNDAQGENQDMD